MLTEKTHYYKTFFEKIWQFEQNEVFVKFWKSAFLWHSHSTDHESERLICDVKRQLFRNWKQDFMHAYPFLRVTSVVACDNFNPSLLECFTFLWEGRRLTKDRWSAKIVVDLNFSKEFLKNMLCSNHKIFLLHVLWIEKKVKLFRLWALYMH